MMDKYNEFVQTQAIIAEARAAALCEENACLKDRIKDLELKLREMEAIAINSSKEDQ